MVILQVIVLVSCSFYISNTLWGWGLSLPSDTSSNLAADLKQELQTSDHLDANVMAYLRYRAMIPDIMESMKEKEILSQQMKVMYD